MSAKKGGNSIIVQCFWGFHFLLLAPSALLLYVLLLCTFAPFCFLRSDLSSVKSDELVVAEQKFYDFSLHG